MRPWHARLASLFIIAACLLCFFHIHVLLIDDGFIAHRYAANLVHGYGLVFNHGQKVEGISDLSWVLLMTIPQLLGWRPELFALAIGVACGIAALVVAYRTAVSKLDVSPVYALVVCCAAACNAEYWIACGNGIETGLYTLVLVSAFALLLGRRLLWAGAILGLATTLRPESLVLAPLALLCIALADSRSPLSLTSVLRSLRANGRLLVPWALVVGTVVLWRYSYYGQLVPNTVVAKSHPLHARDLYFGVKYLFLFCLEAAPWVLLPLAVSLRKLAFGSILGLAWFSYQIVVILLNGGDWMFGYRFVNVFYPLLVIFSARGLENLITRYPQVRIPAVTATLLLMLATQVTNKSWTVHGVLQHHALLEMVPAMYEPYYLNIANVLKPALNPSDIIAPEVLGVVSYTLMDNPMHDWLGLVDPYIAHHGTVYFPTFGKADPAYSVNVVSPTVFGFASGPTTVEIFQNRTNGTFSQRYDCWEVTGQPLILALRRDREPDLLAAIRKAHLPIQRFIVKGSS